MGFRKAKATRSWALALLWTWLATPLVSAQTENRFDQALVSYDKAWKTLADDLVKQHNAIRTIRNDPVRMKSLSADVKRHLKTWDSEVNHQLSVLSEGRRVRRAYREHYGPKAELIAAEGYTDLLRMDPDTYDRSHDSFTLDMRERARGVITDNMVNIAEGAARTLYELVTKRLTMTADWYELITQQNAETGKVGSRSQAAFNLFTAYLLMKGLKTLPEVRADPKVVGEKLTDLIPRTGKSGGSRVLPPKLQGPAPERPSTGEGAETQPRRTGPSDALPAPESDTVITRTGPGSTKVLPPSELPGGGKPATPGGTEKLPPFEPPTNRPPMREVPPEEHLESSRFPDLSERDFPELATEARRVGVPEERIQELATTGERSGNIDEVSSARVELTREIMRRTGWDVDMSRAEQLSLTQAFLHSRRGGLTSGDLRFLSERLSRDPNYFDNLRQRGYVDSEGDFIPGLGAKQAREVRDAYVRRTRPTTGAKRPRGVLPGVSPPATNDDERNQTVVPPGSFAGGSRPTTGGGVALIPSTPQTTRTVPPPGNSRAAPTSRPSTGTFPSDRPATGAGAGSNASGSTGNVSVGEPYAPTSGPIPPPATFVLYPLPDESKGPEESSDDVVKNDSVDWTQLGSIASGGKYDAFQTMMIDLSDSATDDSDGVIVLSGVRRPAPRIRRLGRELWAVLRGALGPIRTRAETTSFLHPYAAAGVSAAPWRSPSRATESAPRVKVFIESLGVSSGEAFRVHFFNESGRAVRIRGEGIVVEPVKKKAQKKLEKELKKALRKLSGKSPVTAKLNAYCLELLREPPSPGMMFRIADRQVQEKFAPMRRVLKASRKLQKLSAFHPDSDPAAYFHSIRQWALWTEENHFDASSFGKAFVERTKKNFRASGKSWTGDIEKIVRGLVPNRWRDIQKVLTEATVLDTPM